MGAKQECLNMYQFGVVDQMGVPITSGLKVTVYTSASTAATIYADKYATSLTNPITSTVFATNGGVVEFYFSAPLCDVVICDVLGRKIEIRGLTPSMATVVFDPTQGGSQLVYSYASAGAELVDVAGTFVDYPNSVTINGSLLRAGDVIHIRGQILCADFHTEEELDIKVLLGTEAILQTGDVVIAANDDTINFDLYATVLTAGSSGVLSVEGTWNKDLNGTVTKYNASPTGANKAGLSEDLSGSLVIKVQGDYKNAHADQESYAFLKVWVDKRSNL